MYVEVLFCSRQLALFNCFADATVEVCGGRSDFTALRSQYTEALNEALNCDDKQLSSDELNEYRGEFDTEV